MLSFNTGVPLALALKNDAVEHIIKSRLSDDDPPDLMIDNVFDLISTPDENLAARRNALTRVERSKLRKAVKDEKSGVDSGFVPDGRVREALEDLRDLANNRLKTEMDFDNDIEVIPAFGHGLPKFDRHIFIAGASGSGKSYFVAQLLRHDKQKRKVTLFSKVQEDKAFAGLKRKMKDRFHQIIITSEDDLMDLPMAHELDGHVVVFDDIDTFSPNIAAHLREYMNDLLETGRHSNITTIATSHELKAYGKTKKNMNEAEWVVLFPATNQMLSEKFLKDSLGMLKAQRTHIISKAARNRYMIVKTSTPIAVIHRRGVMLL